MKTFMQLVIIAFFAVFVCSCLTGCARKTPVEQSFEEVQQAVVVVKESLPVECQTETVMAKFNDIETKRQVAQSVCEEKIKSIEIKYERALFALILIISVFFLRFFVKF